MAHKLIEPLAGPYKGKRISVDEKDADKAIKEGWAVDPYDPEGKQPEDFDQEKATEAAEKALKKWRGDEDDKADEKKPAAESRAMEAKPAAGEDASYKTRQSPAKK